MARFLRHLGVLLLTTLVVLGSWTSPSHAETPAPDAPASASPEPTSTQTATPTEPTPTDQATPSQPATPSPSPVESAPASPTEPATTPTPTPSPEQATPSPTSTPTPTPTPSPSPSPTPSAEPTDAPPATVGVLPAGSVVQHGAVTTTTVSAPPSDRMGARDASGLALLAEIPASQTAPFSMVGLTWDAISGTGQQFSVRVRTQDTWSEWYALAPDNATGTDPIWVGESDAVEVRVLGPAGTSITGVKLALLNPGQLTSDNDLAASSVDMSGRADVGPVPQPAMVTRAQWGAAATPYCGDGGTTTVKAITVHHTAGSNEYSQAQAAGIVRGIQSYHAFTLGWCDIGYNFLIDKYGTIYEGRNGGIRMPVHGAHAGNWNADTAGISFMMNGETLIPSDAAMQSAAKVIAWKLAGNYRDPMGTTTINGTKVNTIFRHGDVMATACPGAHITWRMGDLRARVANLMGTSWKTPFYNAWQAAGGEAGSYGSPVLMEGQSAAGRNVGFEGAGLFQATGSTAVTAVTGQIWDAYTETGYQSPLGFPTTGVQTITGGTRQQFQGGVIYSAPATTGSWSVRGAFLTKYRDLGETAGKLGFPTSHEFALNGGARQKFAKGDMFWSDSRGLVVVYGSFAEAYAKAGGPSGALGVPVSDVETMTGGTRQRFEGGVIYQVTGASAYGVYGGIGAYYNSLGGTTSYLGFPTSAEISVPGGAYQSFQNGTIYWSASGPWALTGAFNYYYSFMGASQGVLGFPTSGEQQIAGATVQNFQYGVFYWRNGGVTAVGGRTYTRYQATGGPTGFLGFPTAAEKQVTGGMGQQFEHGTIYRALSGAAFSVHGAIRGWYEYIGGPDSMLGLPTSNEVTESGVVVQHFKTGDIFWNNGGVQVVGGAIYGRWSAMGGIKSYLARPTGNEQAVNGGVRQPFQNGTMYWSPASNAHPVYGAISGFYNAVGGPTGYLGFPTTGELSVAGGVRQVFQAGDVYWHPSAGTQSVIGAIRTTYNSLGGPAGDLGFPTGGEVPYGTGVLQAYQNGSITWSASAGIQVNVGVSVPYTKEAVFINAVAPMAQASQRKYGVPASVTIAQAILESGWGTSNLSRYGQAYFGVKCGTSNGAYASGCIAMPSWEVIGGVDVILWSHFRTYNSLADSIMDHGAFLRNNSRYAAAFSTSTPQAFAQAIATAGYATDPAYASKLANIIQVNNLARYDAGYPVGTIPVNGQIGTVYKMVGGAASGLGVPVGIEANGPVTGARMVSFNAGMIVYTASHGTHVLIGKIWDEYRLDQAVRDGLGAPSSGMYSVAGATAQNFQRGAIFATSSGTHTVFGAIFTTYQANGGATGRLGLPVGDEQAISGGSVQKFTGGTITWTAAGAVVS